MKIFDESAPILPLWINGRPYLSIPPATHDITDNNDKIIRRTPLCANEIAKLAVDHATDALADWLNTPDEARNSLCQNLLTHFNLLRDHFTTLLQEDGYSEPEEEFEHALSAFDPIRPATSLNAGSGQVCCIVCQEENKNFSTVCHLIIDTLLSGNSIVLVPNEKAPAALLAFAELASRAGIPNGILNVVFGDAHFTEFLTKLPLVSQTL